MSEATIVFVHSGENPIPSCMIDTVLITGQVAKKSNILILTNERHFASLKSDLGKEIKPSSGKILLVAIEHLPRFYSKEFEQSSKSDKDFRNGFWFATSNRFMLIADLMRALRLENCVHLENDVVIYFDPQEKLEEFRAHARFAIPFDRARAIPGIVWYKDAEIAGDLAEYINQRSEKPDFDVLREFCDAHPEGAKPLPTMDPKYVLENGLDPTKYCLGYEEFGGVFDAAALGQYLGGVHWMNNPYDTRFFENESSDLRAPEYSFGWNKKDLSRYPTMTYRGLSTKILSLHAHSKDCKGVSPFNTGGVGATASLITGERLQSLADLTISSDEVTNFHGRENIGTKHFLEIPKNIPHPAHPNLRIYKAPTVEFIDICKKASTIFIYTHLLPYFKYFIAPRLENPFTLMSHNSDHPVGIRDLDLLNHPCLKKWYAQNVEINHSKLEALPIGLANKQWGGEKLELLEAEGRRSKKSKLVYANFSLATNSSRKEVVAKIQGVPGVTLQTESLDFKNYVEELAAHKFSICPRGNGLDTHRFWESQYLDTIPIIVKADWTKAYSDLPVLVLDSWDELANINLEQTYIKISSTLFDRKSLQLDYFKKLIQ